MNCGWLDLQSLEKQARFDLECETLVLTQLDPDSWGASGCGRRSTYEIDARGWEKFAWERKGEVTQAAATADGSATATSAP